MTITHLSYTLTYFLSISDDEHRPSADTDVSPTTVTDMNQCFHCQAA